MVQLLPTFVQPRKAPRCDRRHEDRLFSFPHLLPIPEHDLGNRWDVSPGATDLWEEGCHVSGSAPGSSAPPRCWLVSAGAVSILKGIDRSIRPRCTGSGGRRRKRARDTPATSTGSAGPWSRATAFPARAGSAPATGAPLTTSS